MPAATDTCLVLGANGFIGSFIVEALAGAGHQVRAFDRFSGPLRFDESMAGIEVFRGDLMSQSDLREAVRGCRAVLHFASASTPASSSHDPAFDLRTNVASAVDLLQACADENVSQVYFASSGGTVYGESRGRPFREEDPLRPLSPYGIGKVTIEHYLTYFAAEHGLRSTALRISNPYGPRQDGKKLQGLIPIALRHIRDHGSVIQFGDGSMVRDYFHVADLTTMVMAIVEGDPVHHVYNLGSSEGHSVADVFAIMRLVTGIDFTVERRPRPATFIGSTLLDTTRYRGEFGALASRSLVDGITQMWRVIRDGD